MASDNSQEYTLGEEVTSVAAARGAGGTVVISVRLAVDEVSAVDALSRAEKKTISQVIREAIASYLDFKRLNRPIVVSNQGGTINLGSHAETAGPTAGPEKKNLSLSCA